VGATAQPVERSVAALGESAVAFVTGAAVLVCLGVSNMMLARLGVPYEVPGGSALAKIHPATYLAAAAFGLLALRWVDPVALLGDLARHHPGALTLVGALALVQAQSAFVGLPATMAMDTLLLPMLLLVLLTRVGPGAARLLALAVHAFMATNAALGLYEFATGTRLTPLVAAGVPLTGDWRSSALLGHPLANAVTTGAYVLLLACGGGRDLPRSLRALALGLQLPALAVFGGRAALILLAVFVIAVLGRGVARLAWGKRVPAATIVLAALALPALGAALALLFEAGFFERFAERFLDDAGSAETRLGMFGLLAQIPARELVFGPDAERVATLMRVEGLEFGIESFPVAYLAFYGALVAAPLLLALGFFARDLVRAARPGATPALLFFFAVAATSSSLSGKTTLLGVFVILVLLLMRDERRAEES
jgi:hypothetical protein